MAGRCHAGTGRPRLPSRCLPSAVPDPQDGLCGGADHDAGAAAQLIPPVDHVVVVAGNEYVVAVEEVTGQVLDIPDPFTPPGHELAVARVKRTYTKARRQENFLDRLARINRPLIDQNAPVIEGTVVQAQRLRDLAHDRPLTDPPRVSRPPHIASVFLVLIERRREPDFCPALPAQAGKLFDMGGVRLPCDCMNYAACVKGEPEHCMRPRVIHARRSFSGTTNVPRPGTV